jgi:hypothetical protein
MNHGTSAVDSGKPGWLHRLLPRHKAGASAPADADPTDFLLAFDAESVRKPTPVPGKPPSSHARSQIVKTWLMILAASALVMAAVPAVGQLRAIAAKPAAPAYGTIAIDTRPAGVKVVVDGENRGAAPVTLSLKTGPHAIALFNGLDQRNFQVQIAAGSETTHYVEFAASAPAPRTGTISVSADTPGKVTVDGKPLGATPLTVTDLPAGSHTIVVASDAGRLERSVTVAPGENASIVFSLPKALGPTVGWLSVASPFDVQIYDAADLVGSGAAAKIMLTAGRHDVRLVNASLGFESARRIDVAAGKVASVQVEAPMAALSANARPWAEVLIDGTSAGQTPLSNVQVRVGVHRIVFRHPQFGEQTQTVRVTVAGPNRISADLTSKQR